MSRREELRKVIIGTLQALPGLNIPIGTKNTLQYENAEEILEDLTEEKLQALCNGISFALSSMRLETEERCKDTPLAAPQPIRTDGDSI